MWHSHYQTRPKFVGTYNSKKKRKIRTLQAVLYDGREMVVTDVERYTVKVLVGPMEHYSVKEDECVQIEPTDAELMKLAQTEVESLAWSYHTNYMWWKRAAQLVEEGVITEDLKYRLYEPTGYAYPVWKKFPTPIKKKPDTHDKKAYAASESLPMMAQVDIFGRQKVRNRVRMETDSMAVTMQPTGR